MWSKYRWIEKELCSVFICVIYVFMRKGERYSSVGRALDCKAGGRGFDSRGRTNTQGLKITEK